MTFDEWMLTIAPKHKPTDDGVTLRILRDCWRAAQMTERERAARVCDDEARIRTEAAAHHGAETPEWGRCMAGARAALNCGKGVRNGEEV